MHTDFCEPLHDVYLTLWYEPVTKKQNQKEREKSNKKISQKNPNSSPSSAARRKNRGNLLNANWLDGSGPKKPETGPKCVLPRVHRSNKF